MTVFAPSIAELLAALPTAQALEVDAVCDDFERHWRRARRRGEPAPRPETFAAQIAPSARSAARACLEELEQELGRGFALPEIPGLVVEEEIGRGGMGVVYRARRQAEPGRLLAVKLIPGAERERWTRWLAELADLRHPNLVPLEGFGTHDGLHFVVMPLAPGGDLRERCAEGGFEGGPDAHQRAARLLAKVARAVAFLHRHGILHRDLKPSNILLTSPTGWEPLVCDFGLAGRLDQESPGLPIAGTPAYMAPEQRAGRLLTPAADLWSLGVVLRELLAPGSVDEALASICLRCLAPDPADRYGSADDLADALLRYLDNLSPVPDRANHDRHSQ